MWIITKFSPAIKLTARLSCNTSKRRYTSLVQTLQNQCGSNLLVKRTYGTNKSNITSKGFIKNIPPNTRPENGSSSLLPIALIDLNPLSNNSSKVLLIPLNWHDADEHSMRNTIASIFSKPKNLQQIEAFSRALKDIPAYLKDKNNDIHPTEINENIEKKSSNNTQKENLSLKDSQNAKENNYDNTSLLEQTANASLQKSTAASSDYLDRLEAAVEKSLQQCCLNSMQMFVDNNLFGDKIKGLKFLPAHQRIEDNLQNNVNTAKTSSLLSILNIDLSKLNLNDVSWHQKMPFPELQTSFITNVMLPISLHKKAYSTRVPSLSQQKDKGQDSKMLITLPKTSDQKVVTLTIRRKASSSSSRSKCIANYDFPYLSKLFGTKELLMSCDAYNQALIEAAKRRAALAECAAKSKKSQNDTFSRPQVMSIKGCSIPKQDREHTSQFAPCPPPRKPKKQASDDCKKDDPCKPPECPNPCKDEMEKLERQKEKEMKKKRNKMPSGCESPKCKKDDRCKNPGKSPCKKATNQQRNEEIKCSSGSPVVHKQMSDSCKKDDPCNRPQCPNPCKGEMEKLKRQTDEEELKRKRNKTPTGCVSPKCKKEDACTKRRENPCKETSDCDKKGLYDSQSSLKCAKKGGNNKGKSDSCGSSKDKKPKNPCLDEHNDYKPKCNVDPCKKEGVPCGGAKKMPADPSAKKNADSCGGCGKKEDPCKKDKKKENPCKKKEKSDPCGSKKNDPCQKRKSSPCGSRKEDPYKKEKENPCKKESPRGSKKEDPCKKDKDDPCKKKSPCGSKKEDPCEKNKDDPCKKKSPCGSKKEDPCKNQKEDPCKNQKEDPCKRKSPCGSKQEDPCKKVKDDPCKKEKSSPCISDKKKNDSCNKKPTSPCKSKKETKSNCQKSTSSKKQGCGKQKRETKPNCGKSKKCYSTLAETPINSSASIIKRTFTSLTNLPSLKTKNFCNFGFMRHYSTKSGGNKKKSEDLGRSSQCKSVTTNVPPKRKPTYNPHPKDGLRKCYPTYDMDCKKLCKDARKTDCRKYAFLKDTDNNKRNSKK